MIDEKILSIYIIFGFFIIMAYMSMIIKYTQSNSSEIWSNKGKNRIRSGSLLKYTYIFMIIISTIAGSYLVYYLTILEKNRTDEILIYTGSVIFLVFSCLWAFMPFDYSKFVLFIVF